MANPGVTWTWAWGRSHDDFRAVMRDGQAERLGSGLCSYTRNRRSQSLRGPHRQEITGDNSDKLVRMQYATRHKRTQDSG